jgi:hypothetical protein
MRGPVTYVQRTDMPPENQGGNNVGNAPAPQGPMLEPGSSVVTPNQYNDPHAHERKPGDKVYGPYPPQQNVDLEHVNVDPINATYANKLNQIVNLSNDQYRAYVELAKAKNPGINPVIFDDIQKHNKELIPWYVGVRASLNKVNPNGDPPSEEAITPKIAELHKEWDKEIHARVIKDNRERNPNDIAKADAQVNMAFKAVSQELPTPGLGGAVGAVTKSVYDKEKGGIQLGGVAGAFAGFMLASVVTGGQGFFGIIAGIVMAAAGAYFGNKFMSGDEKPTSLVPPASGAGKTKEKEEGKGTELEQQQGQKPQQQQRDGGKPRAFAKDGSNNMDNARNLAGNINLQATDAQSVNQNNIQSPNVASAQTAGTGKDCAGMSNCW